MFCVLFDTSNTDSNDHRMAGVTSVPLPSYTATQDSQLDGNPAARFASNSKAVVLRSKQKEICHVHIPSTDSKDCEVTHTIGTVPGYAHFDPVLNNYKPTRADLFSEEAPVGNCLESLSSTDLSLCLTTVNTESLLARSFLCLPIPTGTRVLYHNLLHILKTRKPRPTLAALVDYHLLYPKYQSTRSYNLLISLSIHHRAFGITWSLLSAMQRQSIPNNIETYQLHVRWFVYQGFWDRAWSYVMQLMKKFPGGTVPFPIWLEFCHTRKGRFIILEDEFNSENKTVHKLHEPSSLFSARRKVMNTMKPLLIPALKDTPPVAIRNIVQLMVKAGLKHQALKLTKDYFKALPLELDGRKNHRCLDIVKVHLVFNGTGKKGVPRFNVAKTLLFSLLLSNPSLRPTSDTLMFILSTLGRARRCGTIAWNFLSLCKDKWGLEVEDRRVQRRVLKWALKEGRMDIVGTILRAEELERRSRQRHISELKVLGDVTRPPSEVLFRPSIRRIYPRNGREARLWRRLRIRIHRKRFKHIDQGHKFTEAPGLAMRAALDSIPA